MAGGAAGALAMDSGCPERVQAPERREMELGQHSEQESDLPEAVIQDD